ncbi:glycosyltransferase family 4 protein [Aquabacterium sp. J223]|uniref:glycosyltransferase family 4 protein n=1 Tax=Aquabacterium sp. J223 TaxID=2898431 RepID=UPI0021AE0F47|nr:glycosyltransferase family 4 protein [Aquabacterium sp. J223]UUX94794.1 glycosyltransferase family 4 protein [Aquabacterium sp. J223]
MTGGLRILFVSPLDRRTVPNTREQNMADECRALGHETLSLTLAQNTARSPGAVLRDSLSWRVAHSDDGRVVRIDPPLNPCTGLETNLATGKGDGGAPSMRRLVVRWLSPLGVLRDLTIVPAFLVHALRRGRFDLCIAYGPWAACVGWWLRRLGRVGLLVYDDQDYEPAILRNRTRQRWAVFLERAMMRRADAVVSVGHRLAALRQAQTGRDVTVVPNGVPARSLLPPRGVEPPPQPFTLVYVGNLVPWSGLDVMLDGLPAVLAEGLSLRVWIVGDGSPPYVQGLRDRVAALGLGAVVEFVGRVPNERIGEWLGQADVGLAHFRDEPYRRYAFPLKVIEYMAAGLAVIGTLDTETEDILARHGCGVAVACEPAAIAQAILRLANDDALLQRCRSQARHSAPAYLWSTLTARELAVAAAVQGRHPREQPV